MISCNISRKSGRSTSISRIHRWLTIHATTPFGGKKNPSFDGPSRRVIDGPFAETKELIAGFWLWQCKSREEAIEWLKRAPFDGGTEIELRQVFEAEDFGAEFTPELREQEERLRAQLNH